MAQVKHRQTEAQHMEATAHPPRAPYQAHPILHQSLPQLKDHQE